MECMEVSTLYLLSRLDNQRIEHFILSCHLFWEENNLVTHKEHAHYTYENKEIFFNSSIFIRFCMYKNHDECFHFSLKLFARSRKQTWEQASGKAGKDLKQPGVSLNTCSRPLSLLIRKIECDSCLSFLQDSIHGRRMSENSRTQERESYFKIPIRVLIESPHAFICKSD